MIDMSFIGKEGLIIQYEDIISMIGVNVIKYFISRKSNEKACRMSFEDILLSYINRDSEDPAIWLKNEFDIDFDISKYTQSISTFQPNWLYSYKVFKAAHDNGLKNLMVFSDLYSPVIEKYIETYQLPIMYVTGDICNVLKENINCTYLTSSTKNIKKCLEVEVPFVLTICDDYMYTADILSEKIDEKLRQKNVFVNFTSIISAGGI